MSGPGEPDLHARPRRVAYVLPGAPGDLSPEGLLDLLPTAAHTADALTATGRAGVHVVSRIAAAHDGARLTRRGVTFHFVHADDRSVAAVCATVASIGPDVVHMNGLVFPHATLAIADAVPDAAIVAQHHGERPPGGVRTRFAMRAAARAVGAFAFTGAGTGQAAPWRRLIGRRARVVEVLEASSDLEPVDREAARRDLGVDGDPAVLWVGRFTKGKDPWSAIDAFRVLAEQRPGARLWMLASDPSGADDVVGFVRATPLLDGRVHVVGPVPHTRMAAWFSAADVLLSTSRHEAAGFSVIEAMACGCPIVVSDIAPHRVLVGGAGALVPVGRARSFAEALAGAATDGAARADVRAAFDGRLRWAHVADQLLAAYAVAGDNDHTG